MYTFKDLRDNAIPKQIIVEGYYNENGYHPINSDLDDPFDILKSINLAHFNIISNTIGHGIFTNDRGGHDETTYKIKEIIY